MMPDSKRQKVAALQEGGLPGPELPPKTKGLKRQEKGVSPRVPRRLRRRAVSSIRKRDVLEAIRVSTFINPQNKGMTGRCFNCGGAHLKAECTSPGGGSVEKPPEKPPLTPRQKARKAQGQPSSVPSAVSGEPTSQAQVPSTARPLSEPQALGPSAAQALKEAATSLRQELLRAVKAVEVESDPSDFGSGGKGLCH